MSERLLMEFGQPDADSLRRLRGILENMTQSAQIDAEFREKSAISVQGAMADVWPALRESLLKDFLGNSEASKAEGFLVDYRVVDLGDGMIEVLTRLFHASKAGSIFYGRAIRKADNGTYLLWIDD